MDNGLIFPYPLVCANAESADANRLNRPYLFLREWGVSGERGTRGGSR